MSMNDRIKKLREEKGLTQQELADRLYVSRQTICRWEKGVRCPDIFTAKLLSNELNITLDELVTEEDLINEKREKMESQSFALEGISAISQVFMFISLVKGEDVWRAFLAISLFGVTFVCYKRYTYRLEKQWLIFCSLCLLLAILQSIRFFMIL